MTPKPKLWRNKTVTIIAGFNFDRGIVLCADTKHTAAMKLDASKIFTKHYTICDPEFRTKARSAIAYAGPMRYARMAIRKIEDKIDALENPTIAGMTTEIESVLRDIHENQLYKHPDWRIGTLNLGLLIGLWSEVEQSLQMFTSEDTALMSAPGYDCLGSGDYLAHYLIRDRYEGHLMPLADILLLAINMLTSIKSYDDGCGGRSDFQIMTTDGEVKSYAFGMDISVREKFGNSFDLATRGLFSDLWHAKDAAEVAEKLAEFSEEMEGILKERDEQREFSNSVIRQLFGEEYIMP
jgi:20S proteasome alpha/beta subunit